MKKVKQIYVIKKACLHKKKLKKKKKDFPSDSENFFAI